MAQYILIAGANGSGKSTLMSLMPEFKTIPKINLDDRVRALGDWNDKKNFLLAGKEVVQEIQYFFDRKITFVQETTLCGNAIKKNIKKAKQLGYYIEIHFVSLDSFKIAQERVHYRVAHGGHGIPDQDIERRYFEGMNTLRAVYKLCNRIIFYDNTNALQRFRKIEDGETIWKSIYTPDWFTSYFSDFDI